MPTQLIYRSTPTVPLVEDELEAFIAPIRRASLKNNAARSLTGAFAYSTDRFLQAIEGEASDIEAAMAAITADRRHTGINILVQRNAPRRMFPDWSMAFVPVAPGELPTVDDPRVLLRFLIEAAQACRGVRSIAGHGPAPEAYLRDPGLRSAS